MKVGTWSDYCIDQENWVELNKISLSVINLLNNKTPECVSNIKDNSNLVALTIDPMSSEVLVLHHLTQIGGGLLSANKKLVALNRFGPHASVARFKSAEDLFSYVIDLKVPSEDEISKFDTLKDFSALKGEVTSVARFRNMLLLPPFVASTILSFPSASPSEWAAVIKPAASNMKSELSGLSDFDEASFDEAVSCVLRWLWCAEKEELDSPVIGCKSDTLSEAWSEDMHEAASLVPGNLSPNTSTTDGPSNEVLNSLSLNLNNMAQSRSF